MSLRTRPPESYQELPRAAGHTEDTTETDASISPDEADAVLAAQRKMMANLITVLALVFAAEIALFSAINAEASNSWAANAAVVTTSLAIGSTMVGLVGAIFFQMLTRLIKKGSATKFLTGADRVRYLSYFPMYGVAVSCLSILPGLAFSALVRYEFGGNSAVFAFIILFVALGLCGWAAWISYQIQKDDCPNDMHFELDVLLRAWLQHPTASSSSENAQAAGPSGQATGPSGQAAGPSGQAAGPSGQAAGAE